MSKSNFALNRPLRDSRQNNLLAKEDRLPQRKRSKKTARRTRMKRMKTI
jgi:hypothetical protein